MLHRVGGLAHDALAGGSGAREGDLVDPGVLHQGRAGGGAMARHHVQHPRGEAHLVGEFGQLQRRERGLRGRLKHHGVAHRQRRRNLPGREQQREVPGNDGAHDPDRLAQRVVERRRVHGDGLPVHLVGPPRVVLQNVGAGGDVDVARLEDRLAVVEGLEGGDRVELAPEGLSELPQQPSALASGGRPPLALERRARRGDRAIDVFGRGGLESGDRLAGRGIDRVERTTIGGVAPLASHVQLGTDAGEGVAGLNAHGHLRDGAGRGFSDPGSSACASRRTR